MSLNDYLKCPGLDRVANAVPEMRLCHKCGSDVEIWTDEKKGRCSKCGTMIKNRNLQPGDEKKSESCLQKAEHDLNLKELVRLARSSGASDAQIIFSGDLLVKNDLADLCKEPQCENYGLSLSCPPHISELMKVCGWPLNINDREPGSGADSMSWVAGLVMVG